MSVLVLSFGRTIVRSVVRMCPCSSPATSAPLAKNQVRCCQSQSALMPLTPGWSGALAKPWCNLLMPLTSRKTHWRSLGTTYVPLTSLANDALAKSWWNLHASNVACRRIGEDAAESRYSFTQYSVRLKVHRIEGNNARCSSQRTCRYNKTVF